MTLHYYLFANTDFAAKNHLYRINRFTRLLLRIVITTDLLFYLSRACVYLGYKFIENYTMTDSEKYSLSGLCIFSQIVKCYQGIHTIYNHLPAKYEALKLEHFKKEVKKLLILKCYYRLLESLKDHDISWKPQWCVCTFWMFKLYYTVCIIYSRCIIYKCVLNSSLSMKIFEYLLILILFYFMTCPTHFYICLKEFKKLLFLLLLVCYKKSSYYDEVPCNLIQ